MKSVSVGPSVILPEIDADLWREANGVKYSTAVFQIKQTRRRAVYGQTYDTEKYQRYLNALAVKKLTR